MSALVLFVDFVLVNQIIQQRIHRETRHRFDTGLARDVLAVRDDSVDGDVHLVSYLFVHHAFSHCHQHIDFAFREFHIFGFFLFVVVLGKLFHLGNDFLLRVIDFDNAVV